MIKLYKMMRKLTRTVKGAFALEESWDLVARGKYIEAERVFEKAIKDVSRPSFEFYIINGCIKFYLDKRNECISSFENAWNSIENEEKLSIYDRNYLKYYIYSFVKIYYDYLDVGERRRLKPVNAEEVCLTKVNPLWKRRFPSRDHPDWQKQGKGK